MRKSSGRRGAFLLLAMALVLGGMLVNNGKASAAASDCEDHGFYALCDTLQDGVEYASQNNSIVLISVPKSGAVNYYYGGDITSTGYSGTPPYNTVWKAGSGNISYLASSKQLSIENATISATSSDIHSIFNIPIDATLNVTGTNSFTALDLTSATLTGSGTLTVSPYYLTTTGSLDLTNFTGTLNAIGLSNNQTVMTVYGDDVVPTMGMSVGASSSLLITSGSSLTNTGRNLTVNYLATVTNSGSFVNNGALKLNNCDDPGDVATVGAKIKALGLTGSGTVEVTGANGTFDL